jgi:hypothetical protein
MCGKNTRNYIEYSFTLVFFTFCTCFFNFKMSCVYCCYSSCVFCCSCLVCIVVILYVFVVVCVYYCFYFRCRTAG